MPSQPAPNRSLPSSRPTIAAGLDTGWNGSFGGSLNACATHQFYAVDLDIRNALFAPSEGRMGAVSSTLPVRIRSAWIPGAINGPIAGRRADSLWAFLDDAVQDHGLRTVIVPRSAEISHGAFIGAELRKRMQAIAGSGVRLAIGVKASVIYRGHDQLAQLLTLRHTAEEWDLDIALDLSGEVPHYLEAEAAVLRLMPRLSVVRIPSWVTSNGELNTHDPISRRVVATLADQGFGGTISVIPSQPVMHLPWQRPSPSVSEEWTRTLILDQYERRRGDSLNVPFPSSELFREQF
jgi:hypothetical protein